MRELVLEYYVILRSLLKAKAQLRPCLKRCRHCRIFFLTDPRNRARTDLGCPFGCSAAHRRRCSSERSVAYNRSPAGKLKKKLRNGRRRCLSPPEPAPAELPTPAPTPPTREQSAAVEPLEFDAAVVDYLRVVISLVEGRRVMRDEILAVLRLAMRQPSLARERRIDYVVRTLEEQPP